jgi:hypothetical protein
MRPLDKGSCPSVNGVNKTATTYDGWRRDLISRIGYYCVYCNIPLNHQLQVEHVVAKVPTAGAAAGSMLDWDNMLLACGPCNNAKGNKPSNRTLHYLPEYHNCHIPSQTVIDPLHADSAILTPANGLSQTQSQKAVATIALLDLTKYDPRDKIVDLRWMKRKAVMATVHHQYMLYQQAKASVTFNANTAALGIAYAARETGFFGIWFDAFVNEVEVMEKLTDNTVIPGTARTCFPKANGYKPIWRNPNDAVDPI